MKKSTIVIVTGVLVLIAFALGAYVYNQQQAARLGEMARGSDTVLNRPHAPAYGSPDAKVVLVEFFDPACETCRDFYPLVKKIVNDSGGKVRLVLRYAPFHKGSDEAIRILEAARIQNLYWPALEATLKAQPTWAAHHQPQPQLIWQEIGDIGLNLRRARDDVGSARITGIIDQDLLDASALNVTKTPGFFVNGKPLKDFGADQLMDLVRTEVRAVYGQ